MKDRFDGSAIRSALSGLLLCGIALIWLGTAASRGVDAAPPSTSTPATIDHAKTPGFVGQSVVSVAGGTELFFEIDRTRFPNGLAPTPTAVSIVAPIPESTSVVANPTYSTEVQPEAAASIPTTPFVGSPVAGIITQEYGCSSISGGIPGDILGCGPEKPWLHDGLDLGAPVGTPVYAAVTGRVMFVGADIDGPLCNEGFQGYGLSVMIDAGDGYETLYAHLEQTLVEEGQQVMPDTVIGFVGATGCVTGPHLHVGLRQNGRLMPPSWPGKP
jgi:murein DD-endopeptidase MepM/ murein hydrolase activator NlpD